MKHKIKYYIHFGNTASFEVNEWLYKYFNKVKNNSEKYNLLYKLLINKLPLGVKYKKVKNGL